MNEDRQIINVTGENESNGNTSVTSPIYQTSNFYFKTPALFRTSV